MEIALGETKGSGIYGKKSEIIRLNEMRAG
ncbi:hypothetical protein ES703_57979 [subsurface metagenome]